MKRLANALALQGLNASEDFLHQFDYPSSSLLGTINAIYECEDLGYLREAVADLGVESDASLEL